MIPEPLTITTGVAGLTSFAAMLFGGCIKGFMILSKAHNLGKDASMIVCMLDLQESSLIAWGRRAGLVVDEPDEPKLDSRLKAKVVENTLQELQRLLLDTETLKIRYGLVLQDYDVEPTQVSQSSLQGLSNDAKQLLTSVSDDTRNNIFVRTKLANSQIMLKRLWWAVVDKEKIEKLVKDIHRLVQALWGELDPWRQDDMLHSIEAISSQMLTLNDRVDQLMSLKDAFSAIEQLSLGSEKLILQSAADAAELKAIRTALDKGDSPNPVEEKQIEILARFGKLHQVKPLSSSKLARFECSKRRKDTGTAVYDSQPVFIEYQTVRGPFKQVLLNRAGNLAALLNLPKDKTFRSLSCKGLIFEFERVAFVFDWPNSMSTKAPISLLEMLSSARVPSLSSRIKLAQQLAASIQKLHITGWLHKSIRSENILFFQPEHANTATEWFNNPILAGFAFARPDAPGQISDKPSVYPRRDIYRHPEALGEPSTSFNAGFDMYSLGTVLLEIAEWRDLAYLVKDCVDVSFDTVTLQQIASVRQYLVDGKGHRGTSNLKAKVGNTYASAVQICLTGQRESKIGHIGDVLRLLNSIINV